MPEIRGLTVAVGELYARTLEICLARNMRHLSECYVVTTPQDEAVKAVAARVPNVHVYETNEFTAYGAKFNKGVCVERCFDVMGRHGWIAIWDSDCLFPDSLPLDHIRPGYLHGCHRRILEDPARWRPSLEWKACPHARDGLSPIGFFQLFQAEDPVLAGRRPWYDVTFGHAGGGDAAFLRHWNGRHVILPMDVLHLGKIDTNWFGTEQEGRDLMAKYVHQNEWRRAMHYHTPESAARAGELPGRIEVPGYPKSDFEIPFERRARERAERG